VDRVLESGTAGAIGLNQWHRLALHFRGKEISILRDGESLATVGGQVGVLLLVPRLQEQFAVAAGPVSQWGGGYLDNFAATGLAGQFGLGLLLGAVWSPCVGPTLGAASLLAAKGENLGQVAITMLAFGIGAALPLMLLGFLSREAMQRWKGRIMKAGRGGKTLLGVQLRAVGFNPVAANRAGISYARMVVLALGIAGALGGLAGGFMLLGDQYLLKDGFSSGYGFDGLVAGLLARGSVVGVIAAALLFGFLRSGGINMEMVAGVPTALVMVIQGLIVVTLAGAAYFIGRRS